jgi:hypothetical protein
MSRLIGTKVAKLVERWPLDGKVRGLHPCQDPLAVLLR